MRRIFLLLACISCVGIPSCQVADDPFANSMMQEAAKTHMGMTSQVHSAPMPDLAKLKQINAGGVR